ncbi:MAG: hypothetical protein WCB27_00230 [Thermoguttaceae bacterium]
MAPIRSSLLVASLIGLASVAAAQPPDEVPLLRQYTQSNPPLLRFRIVEGRLTLAARNFSPFQTPHSYGLGRRETISLGSENGHPTLRYERTTPTEQLTINVTGASGKMSISRLPRGKSAFAAVEFQQSPDEKATLTLGAGEHRRVFQAANLWQLAIVQPKECRENLFPLLDLLRPDWKIATMVGRAETSLLADAREDATADRAHWATLVAQLGDEQFSKREAADRALRAGAASALNYLRQLDFNRLDAEQQFRVTRIIRKLAGRSEDDSADAAATSLLRNAEVWLALLGRPEKATRETAARQLAALLDKPIDIDPAAEPSTQEAKRERLRTAIEKK